LYAYNHNLDTSREHYSKIIGTRTYDDRLQTLQNVREAGITICSGGIIGMGEGVKDRVDLLRTLAAMRPHPESVPINKLVRAPGTPLADTEEVDDMDYLRTIAAARIMMPRSMVRLAAGRRSLSREARILAFQCGANSIFYGEELLTTPNPTAREDLDLLDELGLTPLQPRPRATPA
jgi:biotin synthase